jgi:hypothetical protein
MRKHLNLISILGVIVVLVLAGLYVFHRHAADNKLARTKAIDFASCETMPGSAVLESSPEVCVLPTGQRFAESPTALTADYPLNKAKYISGFDKAPDSLRRALLNSYFDKAEASCLANDQADKDAPDDMAYITVVNVVGDNAIIHICPSTENTLLHASATTWKNLVTYTNSPSCALTDQYKVSKRLVSTCQNQEMAPSQ